MPDSKYRVTVGSSVYEVTAPDENTAWQWANVTHARAAPTPQAAPAAPPAQPAPEERGVLGDLGRAIVRGTGALVGGVARPLEELPAIVDYMTPAGIAKRLLTPEAAEKAEQEAWKGFVSPAAETIREAGAGISGAVAPRATGSMQEEYAKRGLTGAAASIAETVAESIPVTGGAILTGLLTRNPVAAMSVMGLAAPQTYTGIRERQDVEGIDNIGLAVAGTAASTALDMVSGVGGAASRIGREALKDAFQTGIVGAAKQVLRTGREEAGTEALQNIIEQTAGGTHPLTKDALLETLEAGLAGALGGVAFGGSIEGVNAGLAARQRAKVADIPALETVEIFAPGTGASTPVDILSAIGEDGAVVARTPDGNPFRITVEELEKVRTPAAEGETRAPLSETIAAAADERIMQEEFPPEVQQEYLRLVAEEASVRMQENPSLTQRAAVMEVTKDARQLYRAAEENVAAAKEEGEAGAVPPVDTGMDVVGGVEPSVGTVAEPGRAAPVAGEPAAVDLGGLERPVPSTPVADVGTAAGEPALAAVYEAPTMKARNAAARQLVSDIAQSDPELQGLPKKTYAAATSQIAQSAARNEDVDPVGVLYAAAGKERVAPEAPAPEMPAPEEATPEAASIDLNAQIDEYTSYVARGEPAPQALVDAIASQYIDAAATGVGADVVSPDRIPAFQQFIGNENATIERVTQERQAAPPGAPPPPPPPPPPPAGAAPSAAPAPRGAPRVVSTGKPVTLTTAQARTALDRATANRRKLNRYQRRIARTNNTAEVLSDSIDIAKLARGDKENWALLQGMVDTVNVGKWRLILPTLSTEDIFRTLKGRLPGLTDADRLIRDSVNRFETKEYTTLAEELEAVAKFLKKYPKAAQVLADLQFASVANRVDPSLAATPEEYASRVDKPTQELKAKLNAVTVGDTKSRSSLEAKIRNRLAEIESVYVGAVTPDGRVAGWRDLSRPEYGSNRGKEIFKLIRDAHRRDLEASYQAIRSRLVETMEGEKLYEALEKLDTQFKPAREQVIYFPAMRFGQFYARVSSGADSVFKMFESETKRNQFVRLMRARGEEVTETGNVEDLRNRFASDEGEPLKEVLDLFGDDPKDLGALRSQVFDVWLQTLSAGDMRKHMAPRQMRAGYSTDILKNFANFRRSSINNIKRAQFGYKLRTDISRARDVASERPDRDKLSEFIKEIELRVQAELTPPSRDDTIWHQALQFGNKMAFYQYLATPKTALVQLTQLHIVALPMLAQKYGTAKATSALAKYSFSGLGGFVVSPLKSIKRADGGWTFDWEQPNLLDNPISALKQEKDPELYEVLAEGWQGGRDTNLFMDTFANDIGGYGNLDPNQRNALQELAAGRPVTAALRGATFAFEAMGTLMHQMERVNREATYMAALELAYREGRKSGLSHDDAKVKAIKDAGDTTLEATFDFSPYNKPRILTTPLGRVAGQFFTYPYMMTSLLARNMYTAIKLGPLEAGERAAAAKVATGTLVNIALYAGLTGLPMYGIFKVLGSLLAELLDDPDEEGGLRYIDENGNIKATYNIDWWFRNVWIPEFLGPDGTVASLLGLDDDVATLLARSAEKGPISAITDVDMANSVALDVLFFLPEEPRAETPEGKLIETVFNTLTGAAGGAVLDYIKAGRDLMGGYTTRALEKLPKLVGNVAKASRFGNEGQLTYQGELVGMDKNFWTSDKLILQSLGFNSTEADIRQQQNYEARTINVKLDKAREDMLARYRKLIVDIELNGYTPALQDETRDVLDAVMEFNETYPTHVIGSDTLATAQATAIEKMSKSRQYRGAPYDVKGSTPYLRDIVLRRQAEEETP